MKIFLWSVHWTNIKIGDALLSNVIIFSSGDELKELTEQVAKRIIDGNIVV